MQGPSLDLGDQPIPHWMPLGDAPGATVALEHMVEAISRGPKDAFAALWRPRNTSKPMLADFGTASGTKLLYFLARGQQVARLPLSYDQMVHRTLLCLEAGWDGDPPTF